MTALPARAHGAKEGGFPRQLGIVLTHFNTVTGGQLECVPKGADSQRPTRKEAAN